MSRKGDAATHTVCQMIAGSETIRHIREYIYRSDREL